jgi:solute carrier family 25 (mitochondrial carnitine/acylcarnitine transporter), member 20/29
MENYVYGYISGMAGILASHPFDTLKTAMQENHPISKNPRILYRGLLPPLIGVGFEKAVVFGVYHNTIQKTESPALSGAAAGLAASVVVTPFERIKILIQTGQKIRLNGLMNGLSATWTREIPGFAIYFSVYEWLKKRDNQFTPWKGFLYGTVSGTVAWAFIYPQDRIKTHIQANDKESFSSSLKYLIQNGNVYKGFHFALMRAVPLHATAFATMEMCHKYFSQK